MKNIFSVFFCSLLSFFSYADYKAELYELGSNKTKKLYNLEFSSTEAEGVFQSRSKYTDLNGEVIIEEKTNGKGVFFSKTEIDQKQIGVQATVEMKDGKVFFSKTEGEKTKTSNESVKSDTVVSSTLSRYVHSKWDDLMSGKTVEFRIASWERMDTVGFELKKVGSKQIEGQEAVTIRMKASSFIIAAIIDPLFFQYSTDGTKLLAMSGRVVPKKKVGTSWKDLEAEVFYTHSK